MGTSGEHVGQTVRRRPRAHPESTRIRGQLGKEAAVKNGEQMTEKQEETQESVMSQEPRGENVPEEGQGQPHQEDRIWPERYPLDLKRR